MSGIEDWDPVPASNNAAPPVGAPEDHDRSDVNNIAREMMASSRADWEGSATGGGEWRNLIKGETLLFVSGTVIDVVGVDVTAFFPAGRKIRVLHSSGSPGTDAYCFVVSSAFTTNTRITVGDFDSAGASAIGAAVDRLQIHNSFGGGFGILSGAFESAGGALFEIPTSLTAAGINTAITAASAAGKIVLLDDSTYLLEAAVTMVGGVSIYGRGMRGSSKLQVNYDGYAITSGGFVGGFTLRDFTIDGNASARTAGGGISLGDGNFGVLIENVRIEDAWEYGIIALKPLSEESGGSIHNVEVDASGDHAFRFEDESGISERERSHYSGLVAYSPGSLGKADPGACGVWMEGEAMLSDVTVILGTMVTATGIRLEQLGVAGFPGGGHKCVLNGFRVTGSGSTQTGLFVGGASNVISNGYVETTGASAKPLLVDGRGGSPEQASGNHISGVRFEDGLSCTIATDALRTEIHACIFSGQSSVGLAISGNDTLVKGCTFIGGQATGIQVTGGALDVEISDCTVRDTTADGINVQSGSNDCVISGCTIRDTGGDGIQVDAGADRARILSSAFDTTAVDGVVVGSDDVVVSGCAFTGVLGDGVQVNAGADRTRILSSVFDTISGSDVSDSGTDTVFRYNVPQVDESVVTDQVDQSSFGTAEVTITGMGGVSFPGLGANGTRRFIVDANVGVEVSSTTNDSIRCNISVGPLGTFGDPTHISEIFGVLIDGSAVLPFKTIVTPDSGDSLTVSVDATAVANHTIRGGFSFLHIRYLDG